jgi:hypothetical protein
MDEINLRFEDYIKKTFRITQHLHCFAFRIVLIKFNVFGIMCNKILFSQNFLISWWKTANI